MWLNVSRVGSPTKAGMLRKLTQILMIALLLFCCSGAAFAQDDQPVVYGILLDNSGSLRTQFRRVVELGIGTVENLHKHGAISIFSFKSSGTSKDKPPLTPVHTIWNQDAGILSRYVNSLSVEPGATSLYDAIHSMATYANARGEQEKNLGMRKVLILITDGEDRESKIKEKQLIAELKQNQIKVYAVGLVQELDEGSGLIRKSSRERSISFLKKVTRETGGRALFPKSNSGDVHTLLRELFAVEK